MESRKVGVNKFDLYQRYLYGRSWHCSAAPEPNFAHYWIETKRGTVSSEFTCKYCNEKRHLSNSWAGHNESAGRKVGTSAGEFVSYNIPNVQDEKIILPYPEKPTEPKRKYKGIF